MTEKDRWALVEIKLRLNPHWMTNASFDYLAGLRSKRISLSLWERWVKEKEQEDVAKQQSNSG